MRPHGLLSLVDRLRVLNRIPDRQPGAASWIEDAFVIRIVPRKDFVERRVTRAEHGHEQVVGLKPAGEGGASSCHLPREIVALTTPSFPCQR